MSIKFLTRKGIGFAKIIVHFVTNAPQLGIYFPVVEYICALIIYCRFEHGDRFFIFHRAHCDFFMHVTRPNVC